jgi:FixJ family two-component response regulator
MATVFVVDDDPAVRKALERLLRAAGHEVAGYPSAQAFLDQHEPATPGCVVLDVAMPAMSGPELQRVLAASGMGRPVVFLTGRGDIATGVRAMKDGAVDFLVKPVDDEELIAAVRRALDEDRIAREARADREAIERRLATLTPRELEVLRHVIAGCLNKQIAGQLGTAEKTIKFHRGRVMAKMEVRSVADLVRVAERVGIAPADAPAGRWRSTPS